MASTGPFRLTPGPITNQDAQALICVKPGAGKAFSGCHDRTLWLAAPSAAGRRAGPPGPDARRPLADVFAVLGLAADQVQLAMVNLKATAMETAVQAGDRIALFPRAYPIFADWQTYRRPVKG